MPRTHKEVTAPARLPDEGAVFEMLSAAIHTMKLHREVTDDEVRMAQCIAVVCMSDPRYITMAMELDQLADQRRTTR